MIWFQCNVINSSKLWQSLWYSELNCKFCFVDSVCVFHIVKIIGPYLIYLDQISFPALVPESLCVSYKRNIAVLLAQEMAVKAVSQSWPQAWLLEKGTVETLLLCAVLRGAGECSVLYEVITRGLPETCLGVIPQFKCIQDFRSCLKALHRGASLKGKDLCSEFMNMWYFVWAFVCC